MRQDRQDCDEVPADVVEIRSLFPCSGSPVSSELMNYFHRESSGFVQTMVEGQVYFKLFLIN